MRLMTVLMTLTVAMVFVGCDEPATHAEQSPKASTCVYDQMNTDGEEGICVEEMQAYQLARFKRYNEDEDEFLSAAEFRKGMDDDFAAADANNDGVVTESEMVAWCGVNRVVLHGNEPAGADVNDDGLLDRDELAGIFVVMHRNADADKDGKVTREEFQKHATTLYKAMDADKNEKLTPDEMNDPKQTFVRPWHSRRA